MTTIHFTSTSAALLKILLYHFQFAGCTKDEDAESGNGPSLPHSPHSVEGAIGGPKLCSDSDFEDSRHPSFDYK